jgi:hypothetical protein
MLGTQSTIPQEVGRGLNRNTTTQGAESRGTIVQNVTITIDAKNVKDFNDVVSVMSNISQTARQGRGTQIARIA